MGFDLIQFGTDCIGFRINMNDDPFRGPRYLDIRCLSHCCNDSSTIITTSDVIYMNNEGIQLWSTSNPQNGVDYDLPLHRVKIIGVDVII